MLAIVLYLNGSIFSNFMKSSLNSIIDLLRMSTSDLQHWIIFFLEIKYILITHTFIIPFQKFSSLIRFHLIVAIMFLRRYSTHVIFVTFFIKIMRKESFLEPIQTNGSGNAFKLSMKRIFKLGISTSMILAPFYMVYGFMSWSTK